VTLLLLLPMMLLLMVPMPTIMSVMYVDRMQLLML
jgi:hypothetical protein